MRALFTSSGATPLAAIAVGVTTVVVLRGVSAIWPPGLGLGLIGDLLMGGLVLTGGLAVAAHRRARQLEQSLTGLESRSTSLLEREQRLKTLISSVPDLIFRVSRDGVHLDFHATDSQALALPPERVVGSHVRDVMPEGIADECLGLLCVALDTNTTQVFDYKLQLGEEVRAFHARMVPVPNDEVVVLSRDVTALHLAHEALRASETHLRVMTEQIPAVLWTTDRDLRFTLSTGSGLASLGVRPGEVVGMSLYEYFQTDDPTYPPLASHLNALAGKPASAYEMEWQGNEFEAYVESLLDSTGAVVGTIGIALNITERKQLEQQLRHSQKMEAVGQLAGGVSHDFNNLLTVIQGNVDLVQVALEESQGEVPSQESSGRIDRYLHEVVRAVERATSLTRQLLAFSRRQVTQPEMVNPNQLLQGMQSMLGRLLPEPIHLKLDLEEEIDQVLVDAGQMEQVILNLVLNARDAMPDGGELLIDTSCIEISSDTIGAQDARPGRYVRTRVRDTGLGMSSETAERIFEPFFSTKPTGDGTGLGLSTVHGIVTQAGGTVLVESIPGKGTTLSVCLPAMAGPFVQEEPESLEEDRLHGHETVLVCEDEEGVRRLMCKALERSGYTILSAPDGDAALARDQEHVGALDLLVTDVIMPGTNGLRIAEELRGRHPGLRVLFVSGYSSDILSNHGALQEGMELLEKPFTIRTLLSRTRRLLDTRGGQPDRDASPTTPSDPERAGRDVTTE